MQLAAHHTSTRAARRCEWIDGRTSERKRSTPIAALAPPEALARLRLATIVDRSDVDEALRLMVASKASLGEDADGRRRRAGDDLDEDDLDDSSGKNMQDGGNENSEKNRIWAIYTLISEYMEKE
eukprot:IDg212t1